MSTTRIYLVSNIDKDRNKVYVGKTSNDTREFDHRRRFGNDIEFCYLDEIDSINKIDWKPLETYWIEQFRQWGFKVLNKNTGGGGIPKGLKRSQEFKDKIRAARLGKSSGAKGKKYGPIPEERREKIKKACTGRKLTEEQVQARSLKKRGPYKKRGYTHPEEVRQRISNTMKNKKRGPYKKL